MVPRRFSGPSPWRKYSRASCSHHEELKDNAAVQQALVYPGNKIVIAALTVLALTSFGSTLMIFLSVADIV